MENNRHFDIELMDDRPCISHQAIQSILPLQPSTAPSFDLLVVECCVQWNELMRRYSSYLRLHGQ